METRKKPCRFGPTCKYLLSGSCHFHHDPKDQQIANKLGLNKRVHMQTMTRQPPKSFSNRFVQQVSEHQIEAKKTTFLSPKLLQTLSKMDYEELKAELKKMHLEYGLVSTELQYHSQCFLLITVLSTITEHFQEDEDARNLALSFVNSDIFEKMDEYIFEGFDITKYRDQQSMIQNQQQSLLHLCESLEQILNFIPTSLSKLPIDKIKKCTEKYKKYQQKGILVLDNFELFQKLSERINALEEKVDDIEIEIEQEKIKKQEEEKNMEEQKKQLSKENWDRFINEKYKEEPKSDILYINIIPESKDLEQNASIFIRKMPEKGDLRDKNNYLDIVFKLLHEDGIRSLRSGIKIYRLQQQFKGTNEEIKKALKEEQVKIFDKLSLIKQHLTSDGPCLSFRYHVGKNSRIDWRVSKQLLPGSLVLLSCDGFKSFYPALTLQTNAKDMNESQKRYGFVSIYLDMSFSKIDSITQFFMSNVSKSFTFLVSSAYFVSYRFVLQKLKTMKCWQELPLQEYYVNGKQPINSKPEYLEQIELVNGPLDLYLNKYQLDQSQKKAMHHALTNKLGLIQGPPGTGKTYVGLQIVRFLLENIQYWRLRGPILLITYTNHALNQFLRLIKNYTNKILRIGGKLKNAEDIKELDEFNFSTIQKEFKITKGAQFKSLIEKLNLVEGQFQKYSNVISYSQFGILTSKFTSVSPLSKLILDKLEKCFEERIELILKNFKSQHFRYYQRDTINYIRKYMRKSIVKVDMMVVFWLGIVDLQTYLYDLGKQYEQSVIDGNPLEIKQNNIFDDWYLNDERELDYLDFEYFDDSSSILIGMFNPGKQCQELLKAQTFQECVEVGRQIKDLVFLPLSQINPLLEKKNLFSFDINERWLLNCHCIDQIDLTVSISKVDQSMTEHQHLKQMKQEMDDESKAEIFDCFDIVAMTTTGCAKYQGLIGQLNFPIVIIEEAAEVFEAHITSSLNSSTEHLILIGDHKQLKPTSAIYDLSRTYNLSMSMFERLINNNIPYKTIFEQRRMRPEISAIICMIYQKIQNHSSVYNYPHIKGMNKDVFFLNHTKEEGSDQNSKFNDYEADMIIRLVQYLIQQNYNLDQITVLTLYSGQLLRIRNKIKDKNLEVLIGLKVQTVDNYQGEENDIILLSLTRSNQKNDIGFLKIHNRVCVALSRAKQGLYILGNSNCLLNYKKNKNENEQSDLWKKIIDYLEGMDFIGPQLILKCQNHTRETRISNPEDFDNAPEGGCKEICKVKMQCGHSCPRACHPYSVSIYDPDGHNSNKCREKCGKQRYSCDHLCEKFCYMCKHNTCPPCEVTITVQIPKCQHSQNIKCYQKNHEIQCLTPCEKMLQCGHQCGGRCYQDCTKLSCKVQVQRELPCGHIIDADCYKTIQQLIDDKACYKNCEKTLDCGHQCQSKCGQCYLTKNHPLCMKKCERKLICGHNCKLNCSMICEPCELKCNKKCSHSKCQLTCFKKCAPCWKPCDNFCAHSKCTKKCFEPCDKERCDEFCTQKKQCGHPCIGICGEQCPNLCLECDKNNEVFKIFTKKGERPQFIQLDCSHIFEVRRLDRQIEFQISGSRVVTLKCPKCDSPIFECNRYLNKIKQINLDINIVKFQITTQEENSIKSAKEQAQEQLLNLNRFNYKQYGGHIEQKLYLTLNSQANKNFSDICKDKNYSGFKQLSLDLKILSCFAILLQALKMISDREDLFTVSFHRTTANILKIFQQKKLWNKRISSIEFDTILKGTKSITEEVQSRISIEIPEEINILSGLSSFNWFKCRIGHYFGIDGKTAGPPSCPECKIPIVQPNLELNEEEQFDSTPYQQDDDEEEKQEEEKEKEEENEQKNDQDKMEEKDEQDEQEEKEGEKEDGILQMAQKQKEYVPMETIQ